MRGRKILLAHHISAFVPEPSNSEASRSFSQNQSPSSDDRVQNSTNVSYRRSHQILPRAHFPVCTPERYARKPGVSIWAEFSRYSQSVWPNDYGYCIEINGRTGLTFVYHIVYNSRMALTLTIDRNLDAAVYEQVADQLRRLVATGALKPGTVLPSVRQLAGDLGVNLNTIARAYRLLEGERFLEIRDRAGVVVAAPAAEVDGSARARILAQVRSSLARLRQEGMATKELLAVMRREVLDLDQCREQDDD